MLSCEDRIKRETYSNNLNRRVPSLSFVCRYIFLANRKKMLQFFLVIESITTFTFRCFENKIGNEMIENNNYV